MEMWGKVTYCDLCGRDSEHHSTKTHTFVGMVDPGIVEATTKLAQQMFSPHGEPVKCQARLYSLPNQGWVATVEVKFRELISIEMHPEFNGKYTATHMWQLLYGALDSQ